MYSVISTTYRWLDGDEAPNSSDAGVGFVAQVINHASCQQVAIRRRTLSGTTMQQQLGDSLGSPAKDILPMYIGKLVLRAERNRGTLQFLAAKPVCFPPRSLPGVFEERPAPLFQKAYYLGSKKKRKKSARQPPTTC